MQEQVLKHQEWKYSKMSYQVYCVCAKFTSAIVFVTLCSAILRSLLEISCIYSQLLCRKCVRALRFNTNENFFQFIGPYKVNKTGFRTPLFRMLHCVANFSAILLSVYYC